MSWKWNSLSGLLGLALGVAGFLLPLSSAAFSVQEAPPAYGVLVPDAPVAATLSVVEGRIRNRTLYEALADCDIPPTEILALSKSFKPLFDFRYSRPKDHYRVSVDDQHLIRKFVYSTGPLDEYEAVKDSAGGYRVHKRDIVLERQVVAKVFTIQTSLCQAVADGGESQQIADLVADLFAWDIDFYLYPRKGDRIAVVFERCYKDGNFVQYGKIIAARYVGTQKSYSAFLFNDGQSDGYYDEIGQPLRKMFLRTPVKFGVMTSRYSIRRFHPVSKRYKAHTGIDYGAPKGAPIFATASGTVTFAGRKGGYGKLIIIKHPNGYQTYYGHCSKLLKKPGQTVEQGQVIARVGKTGVATGPHVHYEVRVKGKPINPHKVKKSRGQPLKPDALARFKQTLNDRLMRVEDLLDGNTNLVMVTHDKLAP